MIMSECRGGNPEGGLFSSSCSQLEGGEELDSSPADTEDGVPSGGGMRDAGVVEEAEVSGSGGELADNLCCC